MKAEQNELLTRIGPDTVDGIAPAAPWAGRAAEGAATSLAA